MGAVSCELFSGPNSLPTGKNTGNIMPSINPFGDNCTPDSGLARTTRFLDQSEQEGDQGMNREEGSLILRPLRNQTYAAATELAHDMVVRDGRPIAWEQFAIGTSILGFARHQIEIFRNLEQLF